MNKITPEAKTSTGSPAYGYSRLISGAIYPGVPRGVLNMPLESALS